MNKKVIIISALSFFIIIITCKQIKKEILVSTGEVTNILTNSADASGMVIELGEGATKRGHCWAKTPNVDVSSSGKTQLGDLTATGGFTSQLTNLEAGTKYYIKAYLSDGKVTVYGKEINFITTEASAPTLTTTAITSITTTTASSGGNITSDGGTSVTARGICWNSSSGPSISNSKTTDGSGTGNFSSSIAGLISGTIYYVRAYATNSAGTTYGNEQTFTTSVATSTVPGAPTIGTAATGNAQATATFTAPASNGGSAITGYTVTSSPGSITGTGMVSPITITGLTNGTVYTFTVTATNAIGTSVASSASNSVTPSVTSTIPGAPTIGTATTGNAQATVIFTAPVSNGGSAITGYAVTSSPGNITITGTTSPITVTGLTNLTAYTFTVRATNAIGTSLASSSSNSVTPSAPSTVPGAPTIGTATAGDTQTTVTFAAPLSNGGSTITWYTVTSSPSGLTANGIASPITVTGLTNGTSYTFTVTATNAVGNSMASSATNSVTPSIPATVPGAPTIGTAWASNAQATIIFTAPFSNGGSAVTGYKVTSSPGNITGNGTVSPIRVTGLTNGTAYSFTVIASNAIGGSLASAFSNSVTPIAPVTDIDGNIYNIVTIGAQVWMAENLRTTKYNDGTAIPLIVSTDWQVAGDNHGYIWYTGADLAHGPLYKWSTTSSANNGGKNVCPISWHIPSDAEWTTLTTYLGGESVAGGKLKEADLIHWADITGVTNETGFTALAGGFISGNGAFNDMRFAGWWWSSTEVSTSYAWIRGMYTYNNKVQRSDYGQKSDGYSVRCLRD